jgi:O-antigen/teichoic acid export membrane protein
MKDNFLYTSAVFYSMILSFIFGILVKRIVSPEIVGAFAFVASVGILFGMPGSILRNGLERLVPKYLGSGEKQKADDVASLSLSFLVVVVVIGGFLLSLLGFFFRKDIWQLWAFPTYAMFFIINSLNAFFFIYLKSLNNIRGSTWLNFAKATCFNLLWYICVFSLKDTGYYVGYLVGGLMAFIVSVYIASKHILWNDIKPSFHFSKAFWKAPLVKEIWETGSLLFLYAFLFQFLFSIDKYFVKFLEGNRMLAFYSFAAHGTMVAVSLFSAFVGSFAPKIYFNFARRNNQEYLLKKLTIIVMILSYISAFVIFIGANSFVRLILPNYMRSVPFLKIFALMIIPFAQYNIGYVVAIGKNRVLPLLKGVSILLGIAALLNWVMYKYFGVNGIAWATVICVILAYLLASFVVSSYYHLWYLTLLTLPVLILNFWLVSYNTNFAILLFVIVIFLNLIELFKIVKDE